MRVVGERVGRVAALVDDRQVVARDAERAAVGAEELDVVGDVDLVPDVVLAALGRPGMAVGVRVQRLRGEAERQARELLVADRREVLGDPGRDVRGRRIVAVLVAERARLARGRVRDTSAGARSGSACRRGR